MKRMVFFSTTILLIFINTFIGKSQLSKVTDILSSASSGATADAQKLFQSYLKPYANSFGADLNGGWYNTAKPHKLGGFDLTLSVSASLVPQADKTYDPSKLGLTGTVTPGGPLAQTVAGENKTGPEITYKAGGVDIAKFNTPKGTGYGIIPSPMLQLGIGLIKGTDVTVRYLPSFNVSDFGSVGMWGVGIKHSLKQWIPGIKMTPFFNLSAQVGYTQLSTRLNMNLQPEFYVNQLGALDVSTLPFDNQKMEMLVKGFTGNIIASFDLPVICIYAGIGISNTTTNLKLTGDYPIASIETSGPNTGKVVVNDASKLTNPIDIEMKSMDGSKTKPRLNGGLRFKFALITLHFDYTYANYSVITAGLGISFR
jgi:hypothetical protein